ncbi:MAG: 2OG-Fe(II) oxygenase [Bdellovibrionales bacterium]|nr:2OG-Fe(II) oxygenase [Bdellovibrionales bacterium]
MDFNWLDRLQAEGFAVVDDFLDADVAHGLWQSARRLKSEGRFRGAGIGQGSDHQVQKRIRGDEVLWWDGKMGPIESKFSDRLTEVKQAINQDWFLGLWEWEGHYACYAPGTYYEKHVDPFREDDSRVLSTITYLNPDWQKEDGGELVIYPTSHPEGLKIEPKAGRLVVFFSEKLPHEVLKTRRDRYSITGWFKKRKVQR